MELVYLWVEDYKNIQKQGFNFSPRFECSYDENTNELKIDEKKDYVDIFPKNINVTAIVGENGSGKSNIVKLLAQILFDNRDINFRFVLVLKLESELQLVSNDKNINSSLTIPKKLNLDYHLYLASEQVVYEQFELLSYSRKETIDQYNRIELNESAIGKMLTDKYISNESFHLTSFMYIPHKIVIKQINLYNIFSDLIRHYDDGYSYTSDIELNSDMTDRQEDKAIKAARNQSWATHDDLEQLYEDVKDDYHRFLIVLYIQHFGSDNYDEFNNKSFLFQELSEYKNLLSEDDFKSYFKEGEKNIDSFTDKERKIFFDYYKEFFHFDFIDNIRRQFSDLSHGEQTIFGQMLNIYYFSKTTKYKSLVFLLDEPDLSLHPDWQRKYLNELKNLIEKMKVDYNIILTSHSPFILSDLPKENVIFLKEGKQVDVDIDTFGANIHTLLSHGFFMENGLMGEFAKSKIDDVIKYLNGKQSEIKSDKQAQDIISIIGEPLLKRQLQKMLDSKRELSNKEEIDKIKKQIKELEHKLKNKQEAKDDSK